MIHFLCNYTRLNLMLMWSVTVGVGQFQPYAEHKLTSVRNDGFKGGNKQSNTITYLNTLHIMKFS